MNAIVLKEFGGVGNLIKTDLPIPEINDDEVLILVEAISINPVDVRIRAGKAMAEYLKHYEPLILGWDISGIVTKTGNAVTKFKIGDAVFGMINFLGHGKAYAEYVAAPANHIALKPENISHVEAAAATLAALTAWQFIKHYANVLQGERVLIQAASGGVGHYAVQIAKYLGAYVIATSSAKNRDFVLSLGADEYIAYDEEPFEKVVGNIDFVFDGVGGDNILRSLEVVKPGGRIIGLLPIFNDDVKLSAQVKAQTKGVSIDYFLVKSNGDDMKELAALLEQGIIKSHVSKVFSFDQMAEAHLSVETGKTVGKVVVAI